MFITLVQNSRYLSGFNVKLQVSMAYPVKKEMEKLKIMKSYEIR
jgi:hypothetical protein